MESYLFILRLWREHSGEGRSGWRGRIQLAGNGEVRLFCDWMTLGKIIEEILAEKESMKGAEDGKDPSG